MHSPTHQLWAHVHAARPAIALTASSNSTGLVLFLQNVAKFAGHAGPITSMSFSENG